ncbi:hypothetical protein C2857_007593 [Epichloe festucae Fl1]|uniref:Peptidase A1 domain-containing protein n=1 Tax=Epichloe festucae (strain Fl1) TaxID=877507 RepID=A0A7S9KML3_EPIFF|nr:hypothetical protein C2857_007593 [Epichloe festucae Fl1]
MRRRWLLTSVLLAGLGRCQDAKVVQVDVLHFHHPQSLPFLPLMQMSFGTPPQPIKGIFDTGISDIIIPKTSSPVCESENQQCRGSRASNLGDFDPLKSSDVHEVKWSPFDGVLSGGEAYDGPYIELTVGLGGETVPMVSVPETQVALAVNGSVPGHMLQFPVFGFGPKGGQQTDKHYDGLVARMKAVGVIKRNSFGVVLNPTPFGNGSVVFGGVDTARFKGELQAVPILKDDSSGEVFHYIIEMSSVHLQMNGRRPGKGRRSVEERCPGCGSGEGRECRDLDGGKEHDGQNDLNKHGARCGGYLGLGHGNTINLGLGKEERFTSVNSGGIGLTLPFDVLLSIAGALDTTMLGSGGLDTVDCEVVKDPRNKLVFGFNDDKLKVAVPLSRLAVADEYLTDTQLRGGRCRLVIMANSLRDTLNSLGFPFLSSVYTVFDLEQDKLWFAEAVQNPTESKLQEFPHLDSVKHQDICYSFLGCFL